ncbi:MAG: HDOD domain-containing protein, partial [Woeseia sp.]
SSPSEAANYLGLDVIRTLVLSTGIFSQFEGKKAHDAMLFKIWNDSMRVATLARKIAARYCQEPLAEDYAYMGGMLASIGKLIFLQNLPESYSTIERRHAAEATGYEYIERNVIGHTHTEVGAYLASLWGLPNPVVECVAYYAHPANSAATDITSLAAVHIAYAIVHGNGKEKLDLLDYGFVRNHNLIELLPEMTTLYKHEVNLSEFQHG